MKPWNPYAMTFHGQPITGQTPPKLVVYGPPLTAQQGAMLQTAYNAFVGAARVSIVPNPTRQGRLLDGSRYTIECSNGVCTCSVWTGGGSDGSDDVKLYVDTGWLIDNNPDAGWPTQASKTRYSVRQVSGGSPATWSALYSVLGNTFVDVFAELGAKAGQSFGNDITYAGLSGDELLVAQAQDAAWIRKKRSAIGLIGVSTGLLRCWVKGVMGRRLRESGESLEITWTSGIPTGSVAGKSVEPYSGGVLIGATGFHYVKIGTESCEISALKFPSTLKQVWDALREAITENRAPAIKVMLATYLLAYTTPDNDKPAYTVEYGQSVPPPLAGGWKFSLLSNKCVGVSLDMPDNYTALFACTELVFTEAETEGFGLRFGVSVNDRGTERYYPSGAPYIWFPTLVTNEILKLVTLHVDAPDDVPAPIVNAFYAQNDEIALVRAGCDEYVEQWDWVVDEVIDTPACGYGEAEYTVIDSQGLKITRKMAITGGATHTDTRRTVTTERTTYDRAVVEPLTLRMDSSLAAYGETTVPAAGTGGFCSVASLGGDPSGLPLGTGKGWYSQWTLRSGTSTKSGTKTNVVVLGWTYADCQLWVRVDRDQTDTTGSIQSAYAIHGIRYFNQTGDAVFDGFVPVSLDTPTTGGGIAPNYTSTGDSSTKYTHDDGGAVVLGGKGNKEFLTVYLQSDVSYDTPVLESYVLVNYPLPWLPKCVHSAHMHAWATVCPNYDDASVYGPEFIVGNYPIGAE